MDIAAASEQNNKVFQNILSCRLDFVIHKCHRYFSWLWCAAVGTEFWYTESVISDYWILGVSCNRFLLVLLVFLLVLLVHSSVTMLAHDFMDLFSVSFPVNCLTCLGEFKYRCKIWACGDLEAFSSFENLICQMHVWFS